MAKPADYEGKIIASLIQDNNQIPTAKSILDPNDFQNADNKLIFSKIVELYLEKGAIDTVILSDAFNDSNMDRVLDSILENNTALTNEKLNLYLKELKKRSKIGMIHELGKMLQHETLKVSDFDSNTKVQKLIQSVHARLFGISNDNVFERPTKADVMKEMQEDLVNLSGKDLWGYNTGWATINQLTRGLQPQQLWVVGAYTSIGKSWFCMKMAQNMIKEGTKVLYLSTEMSEKRLFWRLATMLSGMSEYELIYKNMDMTEHQIREKALSSLATLPIEIRSGIGDVDEAMFEIRKGKTQGYCDVVIIDFIQNLAAEKEEYQELTNAVRKLQNLAMRENVGIVLASQNNRESQKNNYEALLGFKGSSSIETCADVAMVLTRVKDSEHKQMICDIAKNRNGIVGKVLFNIDLAKGKLEDAGVYESA